VLNEFIVLQILTSASILMPFVVPAVFNIQISGFEHFIVIIVIYLLTEKEYFLFLSP